METGKHHRASDDTLSPTDRNMAGSNAVGLETVRAALRAGHRVRALARSASAIPIEDANLDKVSGNALDADAIRNVLRDIAVVIQTLGVDFSPRLIFEGTRLFSDSTRILVDAMNVAGVKRLITVTGLGVGDSRGHGGLLYDAIVFPLLLKRVYDDKDVQEWIVRSSRLDWTIVRPGLLKDSPATGRYRVLAASGTGDSARSAVQMSRTSSYGRSTTVP
jgi:putative NADH-flavin reductase